MTATTVREQTIRTSRGIILRPHLLAPESTDQFFRCLSRDNRADTLIMSPWSFRLVLSSDAVWMVSGTSSRISQALKDWCIRGYDPDPDKPQFVEFCYEMRPQGDSGLGQAYTRADGSIRLSDWCARLRPLIEGLAV